MNDAMLFYTALPVLLGSPRAAGRTAAALHLRHGIVPHWFGRGWHPLLSLFAKRHAMTAPYSDPMLTRLLLSFADEQRYTGGILCLIPCSEEADAYLARQRERLEEVFVILGRPTAGDDPLSPIVRAH